MNLLLMRHGSALRGGPFADADRPLLAEGELQAEWAGRAMGRTGLIPRRLWTSPALRCRRTAEIVVSHWNGEPPDLQVHQALAVGAGAERITAFLREALQESREVAAGDTWIVVAHQPDLEELAACLLGAHAARALSLQPGGCVLLRLFPEGKTLRAQLCWWLTPAWFELVAGI